MDYYYAYFIFLTAAELTVTSFIDSSKWCDLTRNQKRIAHLFIGISQFWRIWEKIPTIAILLLVQVLYAYRVAYEQEKKRKGRKQ